MLKSKTRSEELRVVAEHATELLDESAATPKEVEERLDWLMESRLHVREALAAKAWDDEIRQLLDPDRRIDADALVAKALVSNVVSVGGGRPTVVIPSDEEGIPPESKRTD